jgi:Replication-relaxation
MTTAAKKPFVVTPVHDLLLRGSSDMPIGLYHLHQATAEQLTRLHYKPGMLKTVSKRLKVLVDNGYIQADCVPTKLFKSPYYYALDNRGIRYLDSIGFDTDASFRASKEVSESYLHLKHALELNDVYIAALRLRSATNNRYYLSRYIQERTFKRSPLEVSSSGVTLRLIPDGFLDIRQHRPLLPELALPLLIEHDRGTEQQEHFRRRLRTYKAFLSSGVLKQVLNASGVTVAFTTFISAKRVQQMREWTKAELQNELHLANTFIFAELPRPLEPGHLLFERRWYTVTNDQPVALLEG